MIYSIRSWKFYRIILIVQALYSLRAWFLWWIPSKTGDIIQFLIAAFYIAFVPHFWNYRNPKRFISALLVLTIYVYWTFVDGANLFFVILRSFQAFSIIPILLLKTQYQLDLINKFQKVMMFILPASLFFWMGHLVGLDLPSVDVTYGTITTSSGSESQYSFSNHFFYLVNNLWLNVNYDFLPSYLRFSSIFLEPGYLSILMVFLLTINNFDIRDKRNIIYFLTIIASLSLAGFVMATIAYVSKILSSSKHRILSLSTFIILFFLGLNFFKEYNGGQNVINQGIIMRLEYDDSRNTISGYNRTSGVFDDTYSFFIESSNVLTGLGRAKMLEETGNYNVGIKPYIMSYGIIGLVLFIIFLILVARFGRNYQSVILFVLYLLMFLRGDVTMFWHAFILVYVCGVIQSKYGIIGYEKNSNRISIQ